MNIFPKQQTSTKEKNTPEFKAKIVRYFKGQVQGLNSQNSEVSLLLRAAEGEIETSDYSYVLNPYATENPDLLFFPARLRNVDIIKPMIDVFIGERSRMPNTRVVVCKNADGENIKTQEISNLVERLTAQKFINHLNEQGINTGVQSEPVDIEAEVKKKSETYKDKRARKGQKALQYITDNCKLNDKFQKCFYYWLVCDRFYTFKDIYADDVHVDVVDPREIYHGDTPTGLVEDCDWAVRKYKMSINQAIDRFNTILEPKDVTWLETQSNTTENYIDGAGAQFLYTENMDRGYHPAIQKGGLNVMHVAWKTLVKRGILTYQTPIGEILIKEVDETYKLDLDLGDISIEWVWDNEFWELWNIGENYNEDGTGIITICRPVSCQRNELNNTSVCKCPYGGRIKVTSSGKINSIVKRGTVYQTLYNIYSYKRELIINKNREKITMLPLGLLPSKFGKDPMDKFMYHLDATGIGWLDETKANFVAIMQALKQIDLSLYQYIEGMSKVLGTVKDDWWDSIGMNRQRFGDAMASDGKAVTEQAIFRSSVTSSEMTREFEVGIDCECNALIDYSQVAWINGKKATYINSDEETTFLNIEPLQYANTEYGIFSKHQGVEKEKIELAKKLLDRLAQKDTTKTSTLLEMIDKDNMPEIKRIVKMQEEVEDQYNRAVQENEQRLQQEIAAKEAEIRKEELDFNYYKVDETNQTILTGKLIDSRKVLVQAQIKDASSAQADPYADEYERLLQQVELDLKRDSQRLAERKHKDDVRLKEKDLAIKAKKKASVA